MRDLNFELRQLGLRNRDGSYATQAEREKILKLAADQLYDLGYRHMRAVSLKPKHVEALVRVWQEGDRQRGWAAVSAATVKNRMSVMRWWASKVNKTNVVAESNEAYGIKKRTTAVNVNKAVALDDGALAAVKDERIRMSLELQREFGLRREEAIKFCPRLADQVDRLVLKDTWTKGGKAREVPIRRESQRAVLVRAHKLVGRGSLIPSDAKYVQQMRLYERETARVGLSKMHGLRHAYAQERYAELTGWKAPAAGGLTRAELSAEQRDADRLARRVISRELGHERPNISAAYLGK